MEDSIETHLANIVAVFEEVRRVLRPDGTLWLNYGDRYNSSMSRGSFGDQAKDDRGYEEHGKVQPQLKMHAKNLLGLPWRVAFALQSVGWILRSDIIWSKPNPMPDSVRDRPTCAHEYLFLFAKSGRYFYDQEAVREESDTVWNPAKKIGKTQTGKLNRDIDKSMMRTRGYDTRHDDVEKSGRNKRTVWTIATQPTPEAHFATFPEKLVEPCILAGTSERGCCSVCGAPVVREVDVNHDAQGRTTNGPRSITNRKQSSGRDCRKIKHTTTTGWHPSCDCDAGIVPCIVLDPFMGSGTVGRVAERLGRSWLGCEMNPEYIKIAKQRTRQTSLLGRCV